MAWGNVYLGNDLEGKAFEIERGVRAVVDMLHENAPFENGKPTTPLVLGKYVAVVAFTLTGYIEFDDVRVDQQAPYPNMFVAASE